MVVVEAGLNWHSYSHPSTYFVLQTHYIQPDLLIRTCDAEDVLKNSYDQELAFGDPAEIRKQGANEEDEEPVDEERT